MVAMPGSAAPLAPRRGPIAALTRLPLRPLTDRARREHRPGGAGDAEERAAPSGQSCVLLLADIADRERSWGWARIVRGSRGLRGTPGLRFGKVMGSGYEGGFGLKPSASRQGVFLVFDTDAQAVAFIDAAPLVQAYRDRSRELLVVHLAPFSARGSWNGRSIAPGASAPASGPVAALTRGSIRPAVAARFWRHAPPSQQALESARGCLLAVGLGEAPLLRQATFSLWQSAHAMDAYARHGAHLAAIQAARELKFFSESMFVRFVPRAIRGTWKGRVYSDDLLQAAA
jgi:hypothetical protein